MRYLTIVILPSLISAGGPSVRDVVIAGGTEDGHNYRWTVTNRSGQAIDVVEFPYYRADQVVKPDGWEFEATAGLVGQGGGRQVGRLIFRAGSPGHAIRPGQSLDFGLRVAPAGALKASATVTIGCSDGTRTLIGGVQCPLKEPWLRRNFPMIGLGGSFALFLLLARLMKKRNRSPEQASE